MKIICISKIYTKQQKTDTGSCADVETRISVGHEYTVLGMSYRRAADGQQGVWVDINSDTGSMDTIPLCLFKITDDRLSQFWHIKEVGNSFFLWPKEFYREFFHDELSDGVPEVVEIFKKLVIAMEREFDDNCFLKELENKSYPENEWWKDPKNWQEN